MDAQGIDVGRTLRRARTLVPLVAIVVLATMLGGRVFETVESGTYLVKQAAITGTMPAKMTPGPRWVST